MRAMMAVVSGGVLAWCGAAGAGEAMHESVRQVEEIHLRARPLPLEAVRLTGGPLKRAQELDARTLLGLEPDRMLAYYRREAGLDPKAEGYGGWDGGGRNLTGHLAGHYLSAVSLMYAATGDMRFKERADYLVAEFKQVQDTHGDGYLSALAGGRACWQALSGGEIRSSGFDLNGLWSPWYTLHKTFAGLRDAYRHTGNPTALEVESRFAAWAEGVLAPLSDRQIQRMLNTEFGGMNEVLVDLYADTGDPRWLALSGKFEHEAVVDPLRHHEDVLGGKHANTQVPKLIGSLDRFAYTGRAGDLLAAGYFWDQVAHRHSYATGGHGKDEYFGEPDQLNDRVEGRTAETCNVYNMLKMTRRMFALQPDARYADFHERALFNHMLASLDDRDGWACYMVPVGRGVQREYERNMLDGGFTCCTGTSLESHALHGHGLYYTAGDTLYVNLYAPSTAEWAEAGVGLVMETDLPEGERATLTLNPGGPRRFTLALRRPYWTTGGFAVRVNGEPLALEPPGDAGASAYVRVDRTWQAGDRVEIDLPKTLWLEPLPDNPRRVAVLWGPLVLAADLGPEPERGERGDRAWTAPERMPVFVAAGRPAPEWLEPVDGRPGHFRTAGVGRDRDLEFSPFYRLHRRVYGVYWDLFTDEEWAAQAAAYAAEAERQRALDAATVAYAQPGQMQPERDFNFQGAEDARPIRTDGRPGRTARTWFSFDLPVAADAPQALVATYCSLERRRGDARFDIRIDGQTLATQDVPQEQPLRFFDVTYALPAELVADKETVTVRFEAHPGSSVAGVYGLRVIRQEPE